MGAMPPVVLWAWERAEDLTTVDPNTTAVAVLDRTVRFSEHTTGVRYRLHPLKVADDVTRISVIRLEGSAARVDGAVAAHIVEQAAAAARRPRVSALQIDFDATSSQRDLYRHLLREVRDAIPKAMPLSITALTSWCAEPRWLDSLGIDEAVPMAFQMGADGDRVRAQLGRGEPFPAQMCRGSIGVATDEPVNIHGFQRLYIFSRVPWQRVSIASFFARLR